MTRKAPVQGGGRRRVKDFKGLFNRLRTDPPNSEKDEDKDEKSKDGSIDEETNMGKSFPKGGVAVSLEILASPYSTMEW